jgi:VWFA-related protein
MRRLVLLLSCLAWLIGLAALPVPAGAQEAVSEVRVTQVDNSNYPEITLYVSALDASGQPQRTLRQSDFTIHEDGSPVAVSDFRGGGGQIDAALVVDRSGSMEERGKMQGAQEAARVFVQQMRPGDRTALIAFNDNLRILQGLTAQSPRLINSIDSLRASGGTALYDSIIAGVDMLGTAGGRRVLLVLTDGQDCRDIDDDICPDEYGSTTSRTEAIAYANEHEQPLYIVGVGVRSGAANIEHGIDEAVLQQLADKTYGEYFYAPDAAQLADLYARLAGNVQSEYALTYTSPRPYYDGTRRDIQVSVGTVSSTDTYVERHLINVSSHPLVGLLLLLPLLGALLGPSLFARMPWRPGAARAVAPAVHVPVEDDTPPETGEQAALPGVATGATMAIPLPQKSGGAAVADAPAVCEQCGRPLRTGAHFCGTCGAKAGGDA